MGPSEDPKENYNFWSKFDLREEFMNLIFLNDNIFISFILKIKTIVPNKSAMVNMLP